MRLGVTCFILLVTAVMVGGCGGDGDRLTHEEFLQQGNAICKKGNQKIESRESSTFTAGKPTDEQIIAFARTVLIPTVEDTVAKVRALAPAKADEAEVDETMSSAQAAVDILKTHPEQLMADEDVFAEFDQLATAFGLDDCVHT